jgi:hypothetical protein
MINKNKTIFIYEKSFSLYNISMSNVSSYMFHNTDRIGSDSTDQSQQNIHNTRFANYTLSSYFSGNTSNQHVDFATSQPTMNFSGISHGNGVSGAVIDAESKLVIKATQGNPAEKVQLFQRPFATVPYLGRGSCDPNLESQLLHGEPVTEKKSVSTVMDKSFSEYSLQPADAEMEKRVNDTSFTVEESAMDGWVRGGATTRFAPTEEEKKASRPNSIF